MRVSTLPRSLCTSTAAQGTCYGSEKPSTVTATASSVPSPPGTVPSWSTRRIPVLGGTIAVLTCRAGITEEKFQCVMNIAHIFKWNILAKQVSYVDINSWDGWGGERHEKNLILDKKHNVSN